MKTISINLYTYDELSTEAAKAKALDWYRQGALDHDWWNSTYDDAERIGLKITGFGLDRNNHATGEFNCLGGGEQCASLILTEHGNSCDTFKTATDYLAKLEKLNAEIAADNGDDHDSPNYDVWQDKRGELEEEFLKSLLEDYAKILQRDAEYLTSDESCAEACRANEYTFTEDGKRMSAPR